jgi:hypothetical protein
MKLAICFYGFLRENYTNEQIQEYLNNILYEGSDNYDIYYACPDKFSEFSEKYNEEEKNIVIQKFKLLNNKSNYYINFFNYDYNIFLKDIYENKINLYSDITNHITPRLLSMFYSMTMTIKLFEKENNYYDRVIVTRFDLLHSFKNINKKNMIYNDNIYLLRNYPYKADSERLHAEDRIFFSSKDTILKLTKLYDYVKTVWNDTDAFPERLLYLFFRNECIHIEYNDDFFIETVARYKNFLNIYKDLYENYLRNL